MFLFYLFKKNLFVFLLVCLFVYVCKTYFIEVGYFYEFHGPILIKN